MARYKVHVEGVELSTLATTWNEAVEFALVFINDDIRMCRLSV